MEVIPTTTKYVTATEKQVLMSLLSAATAATLIPVPLIQEANGVALKIIEVSEVRKILPREGCEIVQVHTGSTICRRAKGQRAVR
jgi:hypothetical protein